MQRDHVLTIINAHQRELLSFGVTSLYIFGSVARDEATSTSDVDVLIDLDHVPTLFELARIRIALEKWLGTSVDLGLRDSVREPLRKRIYGEAIRAA